MRAFARADTIRSPEWQSRPTRSGPTGSVGGGLLLALGLLIFGAAGLAGQENAVTGVVLDADSNQPLAGAQVFIEETEQGTITNSSGRFLMLNVSESPVTVQVIMLGYRTVTRQVEPGGEPLEIRMVQRALELDELVVTGTPGAQQVRSLGNAMGRIQASELTEIAPPSEVEDMLSASVPGLRTASGGGEVGGGSNIRIRGASSMALASEPLIYIDGVRVNNDVADHGGGNSGVGVDSGIPPSRLNDINPDNIESIEVIKGPAASTLYGTEASNGVINIITKKGSQGSPTVTLTVRQGANWLPDPEELFPPTYFRCQGTSGNCTEGEIVEFNVLRQDRIRNGNEWFQTGLPQSYAASVNGGSEDLRYFFSLDWNRDEGPVSYNWQNKLNGRANLNWTPSEELDIQFGVGGITSKLESASAQQPLTTAIIWACPAPGCEENSGLPNAVDGAYRGYIAYLPERYVNDIDGFQEVLRTTYNLTANHRPTDWFTHRLTVGADLTDTKNSELYRPIDGVGHFQPQGQKTVQQQQSSYVTTDYSGTVELDLLDRLTTATSFGVQYYKKERAWFWARGDNFPIRALETVSAGATKFAEEGFLENKTLGAYLQEQVSWENRIFLTGAVRGDDNSAFGKNFDFVVYPKFSGSWVISEEPFMQDYGFVEQLKLRGAWGQAGQQPDVFAALRTFAPATGPGGSGTVTPENIGNADLEPEVGEEFEVGFDASFLSDRVGLEFTYYSQTKKDAIVQVPARPSKGFPGAQFRNLGRVENSGVEMGVNANLYRGEDVGLDLNFTFSTNDNEVVDLGGLPPQIVSGFASQMHVEGYPLATIFARRVVSADIENPGTPEAQAVNVMCEGGALLPGTNDLSDGGGGAVPCAEAPRVPWGSPLPTWEGAVTTTLSLFQDLQLFTQVDFVGGHTMIDGNAWGAHVFFTNSKAILERTDPILLGYEAIASSAATQTGIIDASFAKLRRVSLSYTLPELFTGRIGADRATLTLSGENLATLWQGTEDLWGYDIIEPEIRVTSGGGSDPGGLSAYTQEHWPQLRRVLVTLRMTF